MKITCIDKNIKKVLETGYFHIPRFQRPYSWEKEHIDQFWFDTIKNHNNEYFIGSFVLFKKEDDLYGIVDGQQRITTITLILCALRDSYLKYQLIDQAVGVHNLVEKIDLDNKKKFILQTESSYPYFQEYIQKYDEPEINVEMGAEETNLKCAFEIINKYIESDIEEINKDKQIPEKIEAIEKHLGFIRNCILKLNVIYIELDNEEDAYTVFETLNTRGKELNVSDLIKNFLLKNLKNKNEKVDLAKDKWNKIKDCIDRASVTIDIDTFMVHQWLSKYEYTTKKNLFRRVEIKIKEKDVQTYLNQLVFDAEIYSIISDPDLRKWEKQETVIKDSLNSLLMFNVSQQTPIIISILRGYTNKQIPFSYARDFLLLIEKFHYIFTAITSQRSSGSVATMYSTYARKLAETGSNKETSDIYREMRQKLVQKLPSYEEFWANFTKLKYTDKYRKDKKIIQYTLMKYDQMFNKNGTPINYDLMTLEHILPQNPKKGKDQNYNEYVGLIGNLIYVDEQLNNRLKNKQYLEKKEILLKSSIHLDKSLIEATEWNEEVIKNRSKTLAKEIYENVFKL